MSTVVGLAEIDSVGRAPVMVTATVSLLVPLGPVQVSVYILFAVWFFWDLLPDSGFLPDQSPEASQRSTLDVDQVRSYDPPKVMA
jgi:hypothetical protein